MARVVWATNVLRKISEVRPRRYSASWGGKYFFGHLRLRALRRGWCSYGQGWGCRIMDDHAGYSQNAGGDGTFSWHWRSADRSGGGDRTCVLFFLGAVFCAIGIFTSSHLRVCDYALGLPCAFLVLAVAALVLRLITREQHGALERALGRKGTRQELCAACAAP